MNIHKTLSSLYENCKYKLCSITTREKEKNWKINLIFYKDKRVNKKNNWAILQKNSHFKMQKPET